MASTCLDPRDERRLIPGLVYVGFWLAESGLCERATRGRIPCELQLDPQNISEAFVMREGLRELSLKTADPLVKELTLLEYLQMTDEDKHTVGAMQSDQESRDAFFHSSNQAANKAAKAVKAKALEDAGERKSSRSPGYEKRKNLDEEMNRQQLIKLGLGDSDAPGQTTLPHKPPDIRASQFPVLEQHTLIPTGGDAIGGAPRSSVRGAVRSVTADLMDQLRKTRRA